MILLSRASWRKVRPILEPWGQTDLEFLVEIILNRSDPKKPVVEEGRDILPDAVQDANKSVIRLHRRVLQKDEVV